MNIVGLVSGGKDSIYNLLEAARRGFKIVALANLHPESSNHVDSAAESAAPSVPDGLRASASHVRVHAPVAEWWTADGECAGAASVDAPQELDSWMLQTVGHHVVPAIGACLGVPTFTRGTSGRSAGRTGLRYASGAAASTADGEPDEVEELYDLLRAVRDTFADTTTPVRFVSVGAIASHYQRLRVEHVCSRLSLLPVSFVWARRQDTLLADMIASGVEAVLVKVAAAGLTHTLLGRTLTDVQPRLQVAAERFGVNVCGEGGEYESLVLDCPLYAWRIVVDEAVVEHGARDVAHWHIKRFHLEPKPSGAALPMVRPSPLVDAAALPVLYPASSSAEEPATESSSERSDRMLGAVGVPPDAAVSIDDQVSACMHELKQRLGSCGCSLADVAFVHLYLSDMRDFAVVNRVYSQHFGSDPPSRSAVQVCLPTPGPRVLIDALAVPGSGAAIHSQAAPLPRDTLHVATLSGWAPLCIGPYCQANTVHSTLVLCAGQIAFEPSTMVLDSTNARTQLHRALLNAARTLDAAGSCITSAVACIVYVTPQALEQLGAKDVHAIVTSWVFGIFGQWRTVLRQRSGSGSGSEDSAEGADRVAARPIDDDPCDEAVYALGDLAHAAPPYVEDVLRVEAVSAHPSRDTGVECIPSAAYSLSPVHLVCVPALPRGALVEVETVGVTHQRRSALVALERGGCNGDVISDGIIARSVCHGVVERCVSAAVQLEVLAAGASAEASFDYIALQIADALVRHRLPPDSLSCVRVHASGVCASWRSADALTDRLQHRLGPTCAPSIPVVPVTNVPWIDHGTASTPLPGGAGALLIVGTALTANVGLHP